MTTGDLRANLAAGNDAFRQMRYSYEPEQAKKIRFFLTDLPMVLRVVILEMRPEWRDRHRRYHPLTTSDDPNYKRTFHPDEPVKESPHENGG